MAKVPGLCARTKLPYADCGHCRASEAAATKPPARPVVGGIVITARINSKLSRVKCALEREHKISRGERIGLAVRREGGVDTKVGWVCNLCLTKYTPRTEFDVKTRRVESAARAEFDRNRALVLDGETFAAQKPSGYRRGKSPGSSRERF